MPICFNCSDDLRRHGRALAPASRPTTGLRMSRSISALGRRCVPSLAPLAELLAALSRALDELGVEWYVFGVPGTLSMLEEALGVSDLIPALDRLLDG